MISSSQRPLPVQRTTDTLTVTLVTLDTLTVTLVSVSDRHSPSGIRNRGPSNRGTADLRLRPHGHLDLLANPAYLVIIFASPFPHFPSSHGHKAETRLPISLFFKNWFKQRWTLSLSLYTTNYRKFNFIYSLWRCLRNTGPNYTRV